MAQHNLYDTAVTLLKALIAIPSFSEEEDATADLLEALFQERGIPAQRNGNNVIVRSQHWDDGKPVLLLNAHHDTVKPVAGYSFDPFTASEADGKLFGLGSNDAGGPLVCLIAAFLHVYDKPGLPFNLMLAATAEEEISGINGISSILNFLPRIDCAIVGEPTLMQMAVAERGLLVLDVVSHGIAGHAARKEGDNAIYRAMQDVAWFRDYQFEKTSAFLGDVSMQVTAMSTDNKAHNVVPDTCRFAVDIRINECYSHEEILAIISGQVQSEVSARSTRLKSSLIPMDHPLVVAGSDLGWKAYGSPTLSDKALMPFPALKLGPGDSARSHTADEFIYLQEIEAGIDGYIALLERLTL